MNKWIIAIAGWMAAIPALAQKAWNLEECITYAIAHNLTVKQQEESCKQSETELSTARWSRLPNLNGNASHSFNFGRSLQADNTYQSVNTQNTGLNLNTSVPLFTGLQIPNSIALARLNLKAAVEDLNKAKEDVSIQVTSAYLQVLFNEELAKVAHEQVNLSRELLAQKEEFFKNGKASEAEWREAEARVAQDEFSAVQADNNVRLALLDLSQLLELPSPDGFAVVTPDTAAIRLSGPLSSPSDVFGQAVLTRPDVKAAQYRLEGASKNIRIAQSAFYPQLSLGAGMGTNYYNISGRNNPSFGNQFRDNFSQYIGLTLSIPIFNRFATRNRVRSARIQHTLLNWQLEERKKLLYKEVQQAYYNAVGAEARYASSRKADEAAEVSFRLMEEKYRYGKASATAYNEARTNWMKAVSESIQARYDYLFRVKILDFYKGVPLKL